MQYLRNLPFQSCIKAVLFIGASYYCLPRLRDFFIWKMQPIFLKSHHERIRSLKLAAFKHLEDLKRDNTCPDDALLVLELGAADGLNLPEYPPNTELVVVEPFVGFRQAFDRRMKSINGETVSDSSGLSKQKLKLRAWYTMNAEQMLDDPAASATRIHDGNAECTSVGPIQDRFDAAVCSFVLCSVTDMEKVLANVTRLVKPGGLFLLLEHVKPQGFLRNLFCHLIQPLWSFVFRGCHLTRRPDYFLTSKDHCFNRYWEVVWHSEFRFGSRYSIWPVNSSIALVVRRQDVPWNS